jgi:SOS-response transcriptional repressor LexA
VVGLTDRQAQILGAILGHLEEHHAPPSIRWLCATLAIRSTNGINDHLRALERKGFIAREPFTWGIKVLRFPDGTPLKIAFLPA